MSVMKNFSPDEEELIQRFIFTNPHHDVSFVYPQPLVAGEELSPLMSAYSRTHMPMQDRVLQFLDTQKTEQTRAMLPLIPKLMEIFRLSDGTLNISDRTRDFNEEFVLLHGHSSIKEETAVFGHVENVADITMKKITGHPLNKPQVKSTRYLSYGKVLDMVLEDEDVQLLPNANQVIDYLRRMNQKYLDLSDRLRDAVFDHPDTTAILQYLSEPEQVHKETLKAFARQRRKDPNFAPLAEAYDKEKKKVLRGLELDQAKKDIAKFVLDYSRVYLTAANKTSVGFSSDGRTIEEIITLMISSPRKEDQRVGHELWNEAKKIAPILLGKNSHIRVDSWKVYQELELREFMESTFKNIVVRNFGKPTAKVITPTTLEMYTDRFSAALAVFPYVDASIIDIADNLSGKQIREVLAKTHERRSEHDVLASSLAHGGLMHELVMGYHGYRDLFRQRNGPRSTQLLTTRLGFETPAILKHFGMDEEYQLDMKEAARLYEETRSHSVHTAEKIVPFGANCRALHSWSPTQVGYIGRLRGNITTGNIAYVETTREIIAQVQKLMPETGNYFKIDTKTYPPHLWKKGYGWWDERRRT